ncbi:MAG: delta-60 repeat domain-containing protein, partial [Chloroflexota bacterium]
ALARCNADGSLDTSFGIGGKMTTDFGDSGDFVGLVAIQSDGKIVAAGQSDYDFALARFNADGSLDTTFGTSGKVTTDFGGDDAGESMAIQSDGAIVMVGWSNAGGNADFALARYNANGSLDTSFGTGGKVTTDFGGNSHGLSVAIQGDGRIVVSGNAVVGSPSDFALARYNANGSLDTTFGAGGKVTTDFGGAGGADSGNSVAIQSDGRIVVAGFSNAGGFNDFALARYNANGILDTTFGTGGKVTTDFEGDDVGSSVAIQSTAGS